MNILKMILAICGVLLFIVRPVYAESGERVAAPKLIINLPSRTIGLYSQDICLKEYPVAIGKPSTPTPLGSFNVFYKEVNPTWYPVPGGDFVPSGPENPLGYRWMGFFTTYGIHGTNAPWSIGEAVSNGCVRMQEADVEELFELVPIGTPVYITYDRCKVRLDANGEVSVGIYPDVYGYGGWGLEKIKNKLEENNAGDWLSDEVLLQLLKENAGSQVVFARMLPVKLNGTLLSVRAVRFQEVNYIPARGIAEALGVEINWDEKNNQVRSDRGAVSGILRSGHAYVLPEDMQQLLGINLVWSEEESCFNIRTPLLLVNDKVAGYYEIKVLEGRLAVPALPLAKALGQTAAWDHAKNLLVVKNGSFPVGILNGQPYIKITSIYDCFGAYAYWNEEANRLELTYPFYEK